MMQPTVYKHPDHCVSKPADILVLIYSQDRMVNRKNPKDRTLLKWMQIPRCQQDPSYIQMLLDTCHIALNNI